MSNSPPLTNSTTSIPTATYVPLVIDIKPDTPGGAVRKSNFVQSLRLKAGEVAQVSAGSSAAPSSGTRSTEKKSAAASSGAVAVSTELNALLSGFEGPPIPSLLPKPSEFVNVPASDLIVFGRSLVALRTEHVDALQAQSGVDQATLGAAINDLNAAVVATDALTADGAIAPIGLLNLESLQMTPAGIERGALIATIPLAPGERTEVVQQEWSVISEEFTSIVTDSLENFSQTGVTDNTQLTQATTSQLSHSNQLNVTASASGSFAGVTASTSANSVTQDQNSRSAADSATQAQKKTQEASSRVTQSHKMTISTKEASGTSETSTRMLVNPSSTEPLRIDYFSMMRKWYVALYRYGLRLTYDVTVPEPGAAMRVAYRTLNQLQKQAATAFNPNIAYADITPSNYAQLLTMAGELGAQITAPPGDKIANITPGPFGADTSQDNTFVFTQSVGLSIDDGYQVDKILINWVAGTWENSGIGYIRIVGYDNPIEVNTNPQPFSQVSASGVLLANASGNFMAGITDSATVELTYQFINPASVTFDVYTTPSAEVIANWQATVYGELYNAAQTNYYSEQQGTAAQIAALQQQINSVDTLTLRREENDEVMKCVLRWLLGPAFEFMPDTVITLFQDSGGDLTYGIDFTGDSSNLSIQQWAALGAYEETISFINQAIDWNSTMFFLYSYFWDVPESWAFIRQIQHPDATRQAFLRAGSARVVLCVAPGWEVAWTNFVETYTTDLENGLPVHPYVTIAQQIESYDSTNYPGIPAANSSGPYDESTPQIGTTCASVLALSSSPVMIPVASNDQFVAGATAIIDTWDSGVQETQTITDVSTDGSSITVGALTNAHSPASNGNDPFPVVQAGAQGLLIAEWFEYTPTSGVDIAVGSDLSSIS